MDQRQRKDNGTPPPTLPRSEQGRRSTALVPVAEVAPAAVIRLDPEALIAKGIEHGISVEGLERLLAMRERLKAEQARSAFVHAVAQFQGACPIIAKAAIVRDKSGKERYRYASLESIVKQVGPLLRASELTYRIDTRIEEGQVISSPAPSGGGWVGVSLVAICIITHREGHSESSEFRVPIDRDSYMSEPQKFGAASTYAKRYAFCNSLGILTGDQDTDARPSPPAAPTPDRLSPDQLAELRGLMRQAGADEGRFVAFLKIRSLADLESSRFDPACAALRKKLGRAISSPAPSGGGWVGVTP
jgi:ERF superfamily protein